MRKALILALLPLTVLADDDRLMSNEAIIEAPSDLVINEWPVMFSWNYRQPVPEHVEFELVVRPCAECPLTKIASVGNLAHVASFDYAKLQQGAFVIVRNVDNGAEIERLPVTQGRIPDGLMPQVRQCRMGGACPGAGALQRMLRADGERAVQGGGLEPGGIGGD
jgi:hypothetical protein